MGDKMNELYDFFNGNCWCCWIVNDFKEKLTDVTDFHGIAKLTAGVAGSTLLVKWLQNKKYIPTDPFKRN